MFNEGADYIFTANPSIETHKLALDIAKKIESQVDYPGEVKVAVVRETRSESVAR